MASMLDLVPLVGTILDRILPNEEAQNNAKIKLLELAQNGELAQLNADKEITLARADIVKTEAASESWLTSNWRPLIAVTFAGLIVARFFGWTAPGITEAEYLKLWAILEVCLGGYVVGRTIEKAATQVAQIIKK